MVRIYNEKLLSHQMEQNQVSCSDVDAPRVCHTEWSQSEIEKQVSYQFSSVQLLSRVRLFATPWTTARQASLSITNSRSLPKLMSIKLVMPSNHLILYSALLLLPSVFASIRVFSNESVLHIRWPKYWSLSFSIRLSNEYSGLIPFRMDWLELLAVQGTLKSLLQHPSSKASKSLEKGMANHFSILALRTPWTVWKGKKIQHDWLEQL